MIMIAASALSMTPLTAAGAHGLSRSSWVAIHTVTVVSKTKSPTVEIACPYQRRAKSRLTRNFGTRRRAASGCESLIAGSDHLRGIDGMRCGDHAGE
ncbi:hypothetical protein AB0H43_08075 [Hamadaea sp. NPDC050747]|uniref:hypothetical protein n=1 Tax=Hamadaea sp. NPDC050747 TaxID=3155789 RepID=UPI0033D0E63D